MFDSGSHAAIGWQLADHDELDSIGFQSTGGVDVVGCDCDCEDC